MNLEMWPKFSLETGLAEFMKMAELLRELQLNFGTALLRIPVAIFSEPVTAKLGFIHLHRTSPSLSACSHNHNF